MNKAIRDMIMRRRRDSRSRRIDNMRDRRDYYDYRDRRDYDDYYDHEYHDGRQGVKGTGRYGIGGSHYYGDRRDYRDYHDYPDYADDDEEMYLSSSDIKKWKKGLQNTDGTLGERFQKAEIETVAEKMGVKYKGYDETDLCLAANMLYSDYGATLKQYIPQDKEPIVYTKLAKDFLEDPDASVTGGEKLAAYYYCVVDDE